MPQAPWRCFGGKASQDDRASRNQNLSFWSIYISYIQAYTNYPTRSQVLEASEPR